MEVALITKVRNGPLVRYRQAHGFTQGEAAESVGVDVTIWNAVECMRFGQIPAERLSIIAQALEVPEEEICPPELRSKHVRLDRVYFRQVESARLIAAEQLQHMMLPDPAEEAQKGLDREIMRSQLHHAIEKLPEREAIVIRMHHGLDGPEGRSHTQAEIARQLNISRERVRQLLAKAERKLGLIVERDANACLECLPRLREWDPNRDDVARPSNRHTVGSACHRNGYGPLRSNRA